ncbi:hypothetical protein LIA77_03655 [Sarocladium implicatum]|nr:hypothetical protein LIA77_03655 [Sarocladium implicatum]
MRNNGRPLVEVKSRGLCFFSGSRTLPEFSNCRAHQPYDPRSNDGAEFFMVAETSGCQTELLLHPVACLCFCACKPELMTASVLVGATATKSSSLLARADV